MCVHVCMYALVTLSTVLRKYVDEIFAKYNKYLVLEDVFSMLEPCQLSTTHDYI